MDKGNRTDIPLPNGSNLNVDDEEIDNTQQQVRRVLTMPDHIVANKISSFALGYNREAFIQSGITVDLMGLFEQTYQY